MQFQLLNPTDVKVASVTVREEHHGDDSVVALTMRLKLCGANTLLDALHADLRHAFYMAVPDQEQLPGVEPATPLLRAKNILGEIPLTPKFEGWTMRVQHGIDEDEPITLGSCRVDKFKLSVMEGGSVELSFNVGTNDVDPTELGILGAKLGQIVSITLTAPLPAAAADVIDGTTEAFERDHPLFDGPDESDSEGGEPDATEAFVEQHAPKKGRGRKKAVAA
jgi:hypothetical protein